MTRSMRSCSNAAAAVVVLAAIATAQDPRHRSALDARMGELERHAAELREIVERHARGEDVSRSRWLELREAGQVDPAIAVRNLQRTEADTRALREELARLQALREDGRRELERRATGDSSPRSEELERASRPEPTSSAPGVSTPRAAVLRSGVDRSVATETRIQGSLDHRRVGHAHLGAGIELRRVAARLASEGRVAAAAAQESAAKVRLEAARAELRVLTGSGSAALEDLFALARCEESLGDHERADVLYTELMSRDLLRGKDGTMDYGPFGRAAATARGVLGWLRESGDWRPRRNVDDIVLPSR